MCKLLEVSRSDCCDWLNRPVSKRRNKHKRILEIIVKTHKKHEIWGVDPIWAEVKETTACSCGTVYRIM